MSNTFTLAFVLKCCSILPAFEEGKQVHKHVIASGEMQKGGVEPDEVTMVSVISACAMTGALGLGKWLHTFIGKKGIKNDLEVSTALVNMYAKCGCIEKAHEVFEAMPVKDAKAWSSMIVGFAIHGLAKEALETFAKMEEAKVEPNHVTLIGVLSACAHGGLVVEGRKYWSTMLESGIEPSMEHYGCMVDLFCRANQIEEASPSSIRAPQCRELHTTFELICIGITLGENEHSKKANEREGNQGRSGCSSIEINGHVHEFVMGNWSHPEAKDIRGIIWEVSERVQSVGHEPWIASVLQNVGDGEKQDALWEHSERLAIAYGLLKTKAPVIIRVVKNLRVCVDCHEVTKTISKLYDREIIVRDRIRFHKFVDGRTIGELNLGGAFNTYGE
ncbi:hypothetical protein DH2020_013930 [Rehmannia glutinosa]|uniref:DYW domain-containing protein n=1 Tax=Rehmannia glutinosa TaxID=99300 RepID=A0ABR0WVP4_REHGL